MDLRVKRNKPEKMQISIYLTYKKQRQKQNTGTQQMKQQ